MLPEDTANLFPLTGGRRVIKALNCIAHAENKRGMLRRQFFPDLFVNAWLGFSRTVAEDRELKASL